jgi:cell division protein ZipA
MPELRWILLGFSIVVLAAIYFWGRRNSRVPSQDSWVRVRPEPGIHTIDGEEAEDPYAASEFSPSPAEAYEPEPEAPAFAEPDAVEPVPRFDRSSETHEESPFTRTASLPKFSPGETWRGRIEPTFGDPEATVEVPTSDTMERDAPVFAEHERIAAAPSDAPAESDLIAPTLSSGDAPPPKRVERRKILSVRLAAAPHRVEGARLLEVLQTEDLQYGKYGIFHRLHQDGSSIFSVASMVEPGTFDPEAMGGAQYPGVTLFAQLPASVSGMHALNEMIACARRLQQSLGGTLQDDRGVPLTVHRIEKLRQEVREFERPPAAARGANLHPL